MNLKRTYLLVALALFTFYTVLCAITTDDYVSDCKKIIPAGNAQVAWMIADFHNWNRWYPELKSDSSIHTIIAGEAMMSGHSIAWEQNGMQEKFEIKVIYAEPSKIEKVIIHRVAGSEQEQGVLEFDLMEDKNGTVLKSKIAQGKIPFWFKGMIWLLGGNNQLNRWNEENLESIKQQLQPN
jgi:hypothetical protein